MEIKLVRTPLRNQIYQYIREKIISGSLKPGEKIKDTDFVEDLGISRTPMREVLLRLVSEGYLINNIGRGFEVPSLNKHEIEETYPIIGALESFALRTAPTVEGKQLEDLEKAQLQMEKKNIQSVEFLELDEKWHDILLGRSKNQKLFDILKQLKFSMKRYEIAYLHSAKSIKKSVESHRSIIQILKAGNQNRAADVLMQHWNLSVTVLLKIMDQQKND
ncbi:MAG: GntR family transcriptional regulator [Candidatus Aminicenantes bacterium]|nr:GntR family transcriptional regulator [Candidatus Aminicenantes bacterium]